MSERRGNDGQDEGDGDGGGGVGRSLSDHQELTGSSSTDGKLKMWVYGVAAGAFVLLIFIVSMIYLAW